MSEGRLRVALTIDAEHGDRPHTPGGAARVAEILERRRARATFFLQGRWAAGEPETARRIAAAGHTLGNHSHSHARLPRLTDEGLAADVAEAAEAIAEATGVDPAPWFRCPFGAGHDDPRVIAGLGRLGYRDVFWDVDPQDWKPGKRVAEVAADVLTGIRRGGDGTVVLLHSWPDVTAASLDPILDGLGDMGAEIVGIEEVLEA